LKFNSNTIYSAQKRDSVIFLRIRVFLSINPLTIGRFMKISSFLPLLTTAAIVLTSTVALADDDSIYIKQCGNQNDAVANQHSDPQTISITEEGNKNSFIATQGLDINQTHGAYDTSSANESAFISQNGNGNGGSSLQIGVANVANVTQDGNNNTANVNQNDNRSVATIFQSGNGNTAQAAQGLVANYALAH